ARPAPGHRDETGPTTPETPFPAFASESLRYAPLIGLVIGLVLSRGQRFLGLRNELIGILLGVAYAVVDVAPESVEIELQAGSRRLLGSERVPNHAHPHGHVEQDQGRHLVSKIMLIHILLDELVDGHA